MAEGIKIRELDPTTTISANDVLVVDKDSFGDNSLTYHIEYQNFRSELFSEDITIQGNLSVTGNITAGGDLLVEGDTTLNGRVEVNNDLHVTGDINTYNLKF